MKLPIPPGHLQKKKYPAFFNNMIAKLKPDDVFLVSHDGGVINRGFDKMANALQ